MPYTVWSRGRLIGETDLEFHPMTPEVRMGWFRPVPEAEALMEDIAVPTREILAYMLRDRRGAAAEEDEGCSAGSSTLFADYAESLQRQESFALELRGEDGAVLPVSNVTIQDTERLRELGRIEEPPPGEDEVPFMMELLDAELEADIAHDIDVVSGWWEDLDDQAGEGWRPEMDGPRAGEQYQVIVMLDDPGVLPPHERR